jgi:hypothetical protein
VSRAGGVLGRGAGRGPGLSRRDRGFCALPEANAVALVVPDACRGAMRLSVSRRESPGPRPAPWRRTWRVGR